MTKKVIIGTRGSKLALWQAYHVEAALIKMGVEPEIKIIKTQGDEILHLGFDKMEGKGFFTKEIETALLNQEIDLAVHSHKDLETRQPEGLVVAAVSARENPSDTLLIRPEAFDASQNLRFKTGAVIGTSSARRKAQLKAFRLDCVCKDVRGNIQTRIQRLVDGDYDAIVLATAGLNRAEPDLKDLIRYELNPKEFIPAPAQGVLALQIREKDSFLWDLLQQNYHQKEVEELISEERLVLQQLDGGCQLPLGAFCEKTDEGYVLRIALGLNGDVQRVIKVHDSPKNLAVSVLEELKKKRLI